MTVKLQTKKHLEFLSLKGGCIGSSESTLVKMPHCLKSHVAAYIVLRFILFQSRSRAQNILPVTVAEIINATQNEDKFFTGDIEMLQVTFHDTHISTF